MEEMKVKRTGYKGFNVKEDGTLYCRNMTFKVGEVAQVQGEPIICENGIHFCWNLNDVHEYYNLATCVICEVEPVGDVVADTDGKKCCTNKLKLLRLLTKEEVLRISNSGTDNTGFINSGNWNTGNRNTGFFNQKENKCYIFDELSDMTPTEFIRSKYYEAIRSAPFVLTEWIYYTDEEKANDKAKEIIGGYLKEYEWTEACKNWWNKLSDEAKETIKAIPNFTAKKFKEITGIKVGK